MRVNLERLEARRTAARVNREAQRAIERKARGAALVSSAMRGPKPGAVMLAVAHVIRAVPKQPRQCNRHVLNMARGRACLLRSPICNWAPMTTVACHGAGVANGKGLGYKVHDFLTVWGCSQCNHYTDAYNGATAEQKLAVFVAGHFRQIDAWRAIADSTTEKPKDREAARWALDRWTEYQTRGDTHV